MTWLQLQLQKLYFTPPDLAHKLGAVGTITPSLYVQGGGLIRRKVSMKQGTNKPSNVVLIVFWAWARGY